MMVKIEQAKIEHRGMKNKSAHLDLLPYALNLRNKNIQELLPYLLTAYTYNSQWSHLFNEQENDNIEDDFEMRRLKKIFTDCEIDPMETSKIWELIRSFSTLFTLHGKYLSRLIKREDDAATLYQEYLIRSYMKGVSYIKYRSILNKVFRAWCHAIYKSCEKCKVSELIETVNYQKSTKLYNFYTEQEIPSPVES